MPSVEERLARIEENIRATIDIWKLKVEQDKTTFDAFRDEIKSVGSKVDNLRLSEAERKGERSAIKRSSGIIAGGIASGLIAVVEAVKFLFSVR